MCTHTHPCGQGGASPQGSSAPLGMHSIWTTERKQKEKGEMLGKKGPGEIPALWQVTVCVCTPWPCTCVTCQHLSASTPVPWLPRAARTQLKSGNEIGAMFLPYAPSWVGSPTCPSPSSPLQTLWQLISQEDVVALMFQHCQFPE